MEDLPTQINKNNNRHISNSENTQSNVANNSGNRTSRLGFGCGAAAPARACETSRVESLQTCRPTPRRASNHLRRIPAGCRFDLGLICVAFILTPSACWLPCRFVLQGCFCEHPVPFLNFLQIPSDYGPQVLRDELRSGVALGQDRLQDVAVELRAVLSCGFLQRLPGSSASDVAGFTQGRG